MPDRAMQLPSVKSLAAILPLKNPSDDEVWEFSQGTFSAIPNPFYPWASDEEEYDDALDRLGYCPDIRFDRLSDFSVKNAVAKHTAANDRWPFAVCYNGDVDDVDVFCASFADFVYLFLCLVSLKKHRS